jgi:hypothetical protein
MQMPGEQPAAKDRYGSEATMTRGNLSAPQLRVVITIEQLGFGQIQHLAIRGGEPCFGSATRVIQEIKLASPPEPRIGAQDGSASLRQEFRSLFECLQEIVEGTADIEVRHGLPFRLIVERNQERWTA